ncbi:MAG: hypothetical protein E7029_11010 [Planctomycetaceae bacterium]|nr:hypothetical protein [Planctomycetaceae bacterium]
MTSRDRVINTLCHQLTAPVPMLLRIPQTLERERSEFCAMLRSRFQNDLEMLDFSFPTACLEAETSAEPKNQVKDEWGCSWSKNTDGTWTPSETPRYDDILELEGIRFPKTPVTDDIREFVNIQCDNTSHFTLAQTRIHPFRRLCALGGLESAQELIQRKPRALKEIMQRFFEYYFRQVDAWCRTGADAIGLEDDLADERGVRISLARWNEILVPMLHEFCQKIRNADKFVYFTGSGNFEELIPGLIYAGVDAIRFDAEMMDAEMLVQRYGQRIAFHPILKPSFIENNTEEAISEQILAWRTIFNEQNVIAECQVSPQVTMRNISCAMLNWRRRMPLPDY